MLKCELQKIIGQNLYKIRTQQKLSREELADELRLSTDSLFFQQGQVVQCSVDFFSIFHKNYPPFIKF